MANEEKANRKQRGIKLFVSSNCPARHSGKRLEQLRAHSKWLAMYEQASHIVRTGGCVAMLSPIRGCGKTQAAVEIIKRACMDQKGCNYVHAQELFMHIRRAFKKDSTVTEEDAIRPFTRVALLCVDELQDRRHNEFESTHFSLIVDKRYGGGLGTILLGNYDNEDAFAESVGKAVYSRISETGAVLWADWASFRGQ